MLSRSSSASSSYTRRASNVVAGSEYSYGSRRSRRQAQRPVGWFSEQAQQERNETLRKQLETKLPIRAKRKRSRAGSRSNVSKSRKISTLPELPEPEPLDIEAFLADLENDYGEEWESKRPRPELADKKVVWLPVKVPAGELEKPPKGWSEEEPDLDPADFPAQIARCKERIKDGIMAHAYEDKLEDLLILQKQQFELMAATPGVSLDVARRLKSLEGIVASLESEGDEFNLLSNIEAIIAAYKSGGLEWTHGLVTYWNDGNQLCPPRPFDWREFQYLHDEYDGLKTGFHVEGFFGPEPNGQYPNHLEYGPFPFDGRSSWQDMIMIKLCLRIPLPAPKQGLWKEIKFIDDTGASMMQIFTSDVDRMMTSNPHANVEGYYPMPRVLGIVSQQMADGSIHNAVARELEVNIWNRNQGVLVGRWESIPVNIMPGSSIKGGQLVPRLSGAWARWRYYTATVPSVRKLGLYDYNPSMPPPRFQGIDNAPPPAPFTPHGWGYNPTPDPTLDLNLPAGR